MQSDTVVAAAVLVPHTESETEAVPFLDHFCGAVAMLDDEMAGVCGGAGRSTEG
jgi:hypothetical protein